MTTIARKHIQIQQATPDDAHAFVELLEIVDSESQFLLWEPGERELTVEQQRTRFENAFNSSTARTTLALDSTNNTLVGFCWSGAGAQIRKQHEVGVAIAVLKKYHGLGVGTSLLRAQISWAREQGFRRMSLSVSTTNTAAINIYKKVGFVLEGTERDSIKLSNRYDDSHIMGLILET